MCGLPCRASRTSWSLALVESNSFAKCICIFLFSWVLGGWKKSFDVHSHIPSLIYSTNIYLASAIHCICSKCQLIFISSQHHGVDYLNMFYRLGSRLRAVAWLGHSSAQCQMWFYPGLCPPPTWPVLWPQHWWTPPTVWPLGPLWPIWAGSTELVLGGQRSTLQHLQDW